MAPSDWWAKIRERLLRPPVHCPCGRVAEYVREDVRLPYYGRGRARDICLCRPCNRQIYSEWRAYP